MTNPKDNIQFEGKGLQPHEIRWGKKQFSDYKNQYSHIKDFSLLEELVFLEVLQERYKNKIAKVDEAKKPDDNAVPAWLQKALSENLTQIITVKESLGLFESKDKLDAFSDVQSWLSKFDEWMKQNQMTRKVTCLAKGTKVLMADFSTKNIEDIKIGDEILGTQTVLKKGQQVVKQKVLNHINTGIKEVLKLKTARGKELICTPDHPIYANHRARNSKTSSYSYKRADELIGRYIKTLNNVEILEDYYEGSLIGLFLSDGWKTDKFDKNHPNWNFTPDYFICQSHKTEYKTIEWLLNHFNIAYSKSDNVHKKYEFGDGAFYYRIKHESNYIIQRLLEKLGNPNKDYMLGFLAGFILGDGTVNDLGNQHIIQKKENICLLIENILTNSKINYRLFLRKDGTKQYSFRRTVPLLFPESPKANKFNKLFFEDGWHLPDDRVISEELLNSQEVYDITTETENFFANGILVHNCPFCSEIFFLKMRTDKYEEFKYPMFKDRILLNPKLHQIYKEGRISKEEYAEVLGVSVDFPDWLDAKISSSEKP